VIGSARRTLTRRVASRLDLTHFERSIGRVGTPRHFLVGRLESDLLRILFVAHDSMRFENVLRRSRRGDIKDDPPRSGTRTRGL